MKKFILVSLGLLICVGVFLKVYDRSSSQHNSKNTIRIRIDRYPNRQYADVVSRRIEPLLTEFHYQIKEDPDHEVFTLTPPAESATMPSLEFHVVRDELTASLEFLKGDLDVLYDSLSIAKTDWLVHRSSEFQVFRAPGLTLSYLGFNLKNPALKELHLRRKIADALPLNDWIHYKLFDWARLFPMVQPFAQHLSEPLLEPLSLRYYTTPVREGNEQAQLMRETLKALNIDLQITTLETSLFYDRIRKGDFDLFSSRLLRFTSDEGVNDFLASGGKRNFVGYQNAELDAFLAKNPMATLDQLQNWIEADLPVVPLYTWDHGLILSARTRVKEGESAEAKIQFEKTFDETFRFLTHLQLKE